MSTTVTLEEGLRAFREMQRVRGASIPERKSPYIIGDKSAYQSPLDRTTVEGRTAHKEHMKQHGVIEAGDMKLGGMTRSTEPEGIKQDIQRAIQEVVSR